ncbi:MAG: hypothetical protein R3D58_17085 [Saprospiraceae bacterium]
MIVLTFDSDQFDKAIQKAVRTVLNEHQIAPTPPTLDPDELLTRKASAKEFGVCESTIDNYKRLGLITPCRIRGTVRYKRSELQAAFSNNIHNKSPRRRGNANRGTKIDK